MGVHQRIDRVARRHLAARLLPGVSFPTQKDILHFEGKNGPDAIKRKSPARDEPWHYIDPRDPNDRGLIGMIEDHLYNLTQALKDGNYYRAAFEAAWSAHAMVDGLTPAHHYPLEEKLEELRGGQGLETRVSKKDKLVLPGHNRVAQLRNNWEYWGTKGIMTTHLGFELGVMTTVSSRRFMSAALDDEDILLLERDGFEAVYKDAMYRVVDLGMYEEFSRSGWTHGLADKTNRDLMPIIIKTVSLGWYKAAADAGLVRPLNRTGV